MMVLPQKAFNVAKEDRIEVDPQSTQSSTPKNSRQKMDDIIAKQKEKLA
jgi:hypothetical protein